MVKYNIEGDCPSCGYTFDESVGLEKAQTALNDFDDAESAAQFMLPEIPLPPEQVWQIFTYIGAATTTASAAEYAWKKFKKGVSKRTCPECGSPDYKFEVEEV